MDFGDGEIKVDSIKNIYSYGHSDLFVIHRYYEPGKTYSVKYITYDSLGNFTSKSIKVSIPADLPPPVKAEFTYKILENGKVKFTNVSQNGKMETSLWEVYDLNPYAFSKEENPTFVFEKNGNYRVRLQLYNRVSLEEVGALGNVVYEIDISNVKEVENACFQGEYFEKTYSKDTPFSHISCNDLWMPGDIEWWYPYSRQGDFILSTKSYPRAISGDLQKKHIMIFNFSNMRDTLWTGHHSEEFIPNEEKYKIYQEILTVGKKEIGTRQRLGSWNILFNDGNMKESLALHEAISSELEIIEVREIEQPKLWPNVFEKSFWVIFKIKADFGTKGKVNGQLKVRYLLF